jgi:hypothetical protein
MAQSKDLATEVGAMRRIEAAFEYAKTLSPKARDRVLAWAREVFLGETE